MICRYEMENNLRIFHIYVTRTVVYPRVTEEKIYKMVSFKNVCRFLFSNAGSSCIFFQQFRDHGCGVHTWSWSFSRAKQVKQFWSPTTMGSMGYPKIAIFIYVHGENDWELRNILFSSIKFEAFGNGPARRLLSALMTPSSQCLGSGPVFAKYHRVLVRFEACSRIFICLYYIYILFPL